MKVENFFLNTILGIQKKILYVEQEEIWYFAEYNFLFRYHLPTHSLNVNNDLWEVLKSNGMSFAEIQEFIKNEIEKHLKIRIRYCIKGRYLE